MHFAAEARGDTATFSSATRSGRLTEAAQARARELGKRLAQLKLDDSYGCPGCADGPTYVAVVHHADGTQSRHAFDPMQLEELPSPLRDAAALIDEVDGAFARCESTTLIQIGSECAQRKERAEDIPTGRP
jgi:hypothetical protein